MRMTPHVFHLHHLLRLCQRRIHRFRWAQRCFYQHRNHVIACNGWSPRSIACQLNTQTEKIRWLCLLNNRRDIDSTHRLCSLPATWELKHSLVVVHIGLILINSTGVLETKLPWEIYPTMSEGVWTSILPSLEYLLTCCIATVIPSSIRIFPRTFSELKMPCKFKLTSSAIYRAETKSFLFLYQLALSESNHIYFRSHWSVLDVYSTASIIEHSTAASLELWLTTMWSKNSVLRDASSTESSLYSTTPCATTYKMEAQCQHIPFLPKKAA